MRIDAFRVSEVVLSLSCQDREGIVHAVAGFVVDCGGSIVDSQQFGDPATGRFFMRVHVRLTELAVLDDMRFRFGAIATRFDMLWSLTDASARPRVAILVSKIGHCLNDLLYRVSTGQLNLEVAVVVSNHTDFAELVAGHGVRFVHIPVTPDTKDVAERRLQGLVNELDIDFIVLARYMQVLSGGLCRALSGRVINIHHSFLPSFKGARPYQQAHDRGVKLVGATAHYVTADLDEGPIIEQEVVRVDHGFGPTELMLAAQDAERVALARAVRWHAERRVLLNGQKTVVFPRG